MSPQGLQTTSCLAYLLVQIRREPWLLDISPEKGVYLIAYSAGKCITACLFKYNAASWHQRVSIPTIPVGISNRNKRSVLYQFGGKMNLYVASIQSNLRPRGNPKTSPEDRLPLCSSNSTSNQSITHWTAHDQLVCWKFLIIWWALRKTSQDCSNDVSKGKL